MSRIALGMQQTIYMGSLSSRRDWGHAKDYVRAMHLILQQDKPDDYVIATGITTTIRDFIKMAGEEIGLEISFTGEGQDEKGTITGVNLSVFNHHVGDTYLPAIREMMKNKQVIVEVDPQYYRPTEVELLIGDPAKAMKQLGWKPEYDLKGLITDMMQSDLHLMKKDAYLKAGGFNTLNYYE